ncbi:MAG TPA: hypothetical protein VFA09_11380 [Ktedonobacteraceae bacterium]|nr:hypothetical protein [Ktedonobacteraceae bacterium]
MNQAADVGRRAVFHENDLVIWHYSHGNRSIPVPAVVVREEQDGVVIRARIEGKTEVLHVDPNQLVTR